ncbi:efflux RND transporter periplasmic adaptor subunit [Negadavirga shengliensis]|uniref:Efflux RND transporter periplasmic adaptor subunit n=1 Tax=Negadavirga shengliensis TaxID=1389218 RepID=A0ABV9T3S6_9BACT
MKKLITPALLALLAVWIGYTLFSNKKEMSAKAESAMQTSKYIPVKTETVGKSPYSITFTANGTFQPNQELNLQSEASGKVVSIYKRKGDFVSKGDLIAKLDDELIHAEWTVSEIKTAQAEKDLARYQNLSGTDAITKKQLEEAENGLEMAKAELKMIQKRLSNTAITAPISGIINQDYLEIGALLSPGMPIADIVNTDFIKLVIKVSEAEVINISKGDQVKVGVGTLPDLELAGEVVFIASKGDATMHYEVEIILKDKHQNIRPGMYGYAGFFYGKDEALLIDRKALAGGLKNPEVFVVEDGIAIRKKIKVSQLGEEKLLVLEGLNEGEKLITSGLINLKDQVAVIER